jgi:hypothetical protein
VLLSGFEACVRERKKVSAGTDASCVGSTRLLAFLGTIQCSIRSASLLYTTIRYISILKVFSRRLYKVFLEEAARRHHIH